MEHTRGDGVAVIDALASLGRALGYEATPEHLVGTGAAVDLSWTSGRNTSPLFVFEVESTASGGMANNATKVFGAPPGSPSRPLFFFHVVLRGSADNERIRNLRHMWGHHNYEVYRFADDNDRAALLAEILRQHRRIQDHLTPARLAHALSAPVWGDDTTLIIDSLTLCEDLGFCASYLYDYAVAATAEPRLVSLFTSRLRRLDEAEPVSEYDRYANEQHDCEGYRDSVGGYVPGLLELALRIHTEDIPDRDGPGVFEAWATRTTGWRQIDAAFGLAREYDDFVICVAPNHYAWAAALLWDRPASRDWIVGDLFALLDRERSEGVLAPFRWAAVVWLAHLLVATPDPGQANCSSLDVHGMYRELERHVDEAGGIPASLLSSPPRPLAVLQTMPDQPGRWFDLEPDGPLPSFTDLRSLGQGLGKGLGGPRGLQGGQAIHLDPLVTCLRALTADAPYLEPTAPLVATIYRQRA